MSIHDGHRTRLRRRFLEEGLDHFTEAQALELLLFYAVPQKDTAPLARELLSCFGSLPQVLEAPVSELQKVAGIGEYTAALLRLTMEMGRFYQVSRSSQGRILTTLEACADYLVPNFYGRRTETVFILCLDAKCKVLCCKEVGEGSINSTTISVRKIVETALGVGATTVILAHNHPSGIAVPSEDDVKTTRRVAMALQAVEVNLADHIVVADGDYTSMAASNSYFRDCLMI